MESVVEMTEDRRGSSERVERGGGRKRRIQELQQRMKKEKEKIGEIKWSKGRLRG